MQEFRIEPIRESRGRLCREILNELPDWFGIPEAIDDYAVIAEHADMFGAVCGQFVGGFVVVRNTSESASEIVVMAIRPTLHRRGLGSGLVRAANSWASESGRRFLTVKTVGPSRVDAAYEMTRRFYIAVGFEPIEELIGLWDGNPCLLMLKDV